MPNTAGPAPGTDVATPDLTVVVPAYRCAETIEQALRSLVDQDLAADRYEVVVVLNGPDDGTSEIVRGVAGADHHNRIVVIQSPASSAGSARNDGVAVARGRFTTFVDSDDWVSPDYLALLLGSAHPDRISVTRLDDVNEDGSVSGATAVNRFIDAHTSERVPVQKALPLSSLNACKAYPTDWLRETPFDGELESGEDVVLAGQLFAPYLRQFVEFDLTPARRGATYYRRLTGQSVSRQDQSVDFAVRQRLEVIDRMTRGYQREPGDRTRLVRGLVEAQLGFVRRFATAHPEEASKIRRLVTDKGIPGISARAADLSEAGGYALYQAHDVTGSVAVAAADADQFRPFAPLIGYLLRHRVDVHLLHVTGSLSADLRPRSVESGRRSTAGSRSAPAAAGLPRATALTTRIRRRGARLWHNAPRLWSPVRRTMRSASARRLVASEALDAAPDLNRAKHSLALDEAGASLLRAHGAPDVHTDAPGAHLALLVMRVAAGSSKLSAKDAMALRTASTTFRQMRRPDQLDAFPGLWAMVGQRLIEADRAMAATKVLDDAMALFGSGPEWVASGLEAVSSLRALAAGKRVAEVDDIARRAFAAADGALAVDEVNRAAFIATAGLKALFGPRSTAPVMSSPLIDEPRRYLEPLRTSRIGAVLRTPGPSGEGPGGAPEPPDGPAASAASAAREAPSRERRPLVTIVPGDDRSFAREAAAALRPHAQVRTLDLVDRRMPDHDARFDVEGVRERLDGGLGRRVTGDLTAREALSSDAVLVDGAGRTLARVTRVAPPGSRIIARVHGRDSLGFWIHAIDWSRVDDVIFPSEHIRTTTLALLDGGLDGRRTHVIPPKVDLEQPAPKAAGAERTLGLMNWARPSKDPLWALEVLAQLRHRDRDWRMLLIGDDWAQEAGMASPTAAFRERALKPDLVDAINYVAATPALAPHLSAVGWALSSSTRESHPTDLLTVAATGAVPVVRDWPLYAKVGGARTVLPPEWVVSSPQEAAQRILGLSSSGRWEAAGAEATDVVTRRLVGADTDAQLRDIVCRRSEPSPVPPADPTPA